MNKAQKTTWWKAAVSAATLLISGSVILYAWVNEINLIDMERPTRTRLIMLPGTIPLILIVILSTRFRKKDYDERDNIIEYKSNGVGYIAAFIFLTVAGYCLFLINPRGSTQNIYGYARYVSCLLSGFCIVLRIIFGCTDSVWLEGQGRQRFRTGY